MTGLMWVAVVCVLVPLPFLVCFGMDSLWTDAARQMCPALLKSLRNGSVSVPLF
ncbi:hypothetical protein AB0D58_32335 [Streptomyces sp. NPDC048210]|uniref:hypothetical protein n=1 Tax=unclassified Streptomyces TaxID=2593676 RepID=UPI002E7A7AEF|nr:hypothetical protein [Streptomyces sp. JV181]MEE1775544.1 hypothetical protein [Streptomyces sp. JV181]